MSETLSQSIASTIRESIQSGSYLPGDRLVELTLSQALEVSQNTIRDALHILEQEGWVNKIPRRGVYIPTFTTAEVREIYALWEAVESLALEWAMPQFPDRERQHVRDMLIHAEQQANYQHWNLANHTLRYLHTAIATQANAPRTRHILSRIHNQTHLLEIQRMHLIPFSNEEWEHRLELYFDVLDAIDHQDANRAHKYHKRTIHYGAELVIPYLE